MNNKIVVIDDDRVTVRLLEGILTRSEFYVFSTRDGESGYELAIQEKPDIVICDFLLPKIDGIEVCKRIKQHPELSRTKVILMTAVYKGATAKDALRESMADEFVEKPFETSVLMKKVYKLCQEIAEDEEKQG
ncbi:MAG: response regulator [Clostridiales bacterium]|jgi:sigma-B regulation protein RsbU (phosphoserine phosphatase)|nr:response regulator [Clostridiales bacterium]